MIVTRYSRLVHDDHVASLTSSMARSASMVSRRKPASETAEQLPPLEGVLARLVARTVPAFDATDLTGTVSGEVQHAA
jgi:hypothetical protein